MLLVTLPFRLWRKRVAIGRTGWAQLSIDGPIVDMPQPRRHWTELLKSGGHKSELSLVLLAQALDELGRDPRARGLFVALRSVRGGPAKLRSLREQLEGLRMRGKQVIVHLPHGASLGELAVAASADAVWLDPDASIAPLGVAATIPYLRDGLARVGIAAEVLACGRYKTAAEGFTRSDMSEAQREQLEALLGDLFEDAVEALVRGRKVERARVEAWIEESPWSARAALQQGIVDALVTDQEVAERLESWTGSSTERATDGSASGADVSSSLADATPIAGAVQLDPDRAREPVALDVYARARRVRFVPWRARPYLAVVDVHGAIVSEPRPGAALAAESSVIEALERARRDRRARAVVLHVDSRGGSALASARIARAVRRLRGTKPVVAYFSDTAASGGYMIGVGAQKIVAQPVCLTGSIGVVAAKPVIGELLGRIGVRLEVVKRGPRADMFSPARSFEPDERAAFERELETLYDEFVRVVAEGRGRDEAEIRTLAEGRVWSGQAAFTGGLIDVLGGFPRALEEARILIGPEGRGLEPRRVRRSPWAALRGTPGLAAVWGGFRGLLGGDPSGLVWESWGREGRGWESSGAELGEILRECWLAAEQGSRGLAHCAVWIDVWIE